MNVRSEKPITFNAFCDRNKIKAEGFSSPNMAGPYQQWLQRQHNRYCQHIVDGKKDVFVMEPFNARLSDQEHFVVWDRKLKRKFKQYDRR